MGRFLNPIVLMFICSTCTTFALSAGIGIPAAIQQSLQEIFASDITAVNESLHAFYQARDDLNETATLTPWLTPGLAGTGVMSFNPLGLLQFKMKIKTMIDRKWEYITLKSNLTKKIESTLYNMSEPLFQTMSLAKGRPGAGDVDILGMVAGMFGLQQDVDEGEDGSEESDSTSREERDVTESRDRDEVKSRAFWRFKALEKKREILKKKYDFVQKKKTAWKKFVQDRMNVAESIEAVSEELEEESSQREQLLGDIKERIWLKFEPRIRDLNESRNALVKTKQEMVAMATQSPWQHFTVGSGVATFDPVALFSFKAMIKDLIEQKISYGKEKESLRLDMELEINNLLSEHLDDSLTSLEEPHIESVADLDEYVEPVLDELQQLDTGDASTAYDDDVLDELQQLDTGDASTAYDDDDASTGEPGNDDTISDPVDSVLGEDVFVDLPFADALKLAARPPPGGLNGKGDNSSEVIAVAVLGMVAVVGAIGLVAGIAVRKHARRNMYTQVA